MNEHGLKCHGNCHAVNPLKKTKLENKQENREVRF